MPPLVADAVAAVLAIVIAPFLLRTFDQMQQRVTRQNNELRILHAIDSAISGTLDLQTVLEVAVKEVTLAVDGEVGALWLFAEETAWPQPTAQAFYNLTPGMQAALTERLGAGADRSGPPHRRHPAQAQGLEETWKTDRAAAALKLRNQIVVPIKQRETVLGVFLVGNRGGALNPLQGFDGRRPDAAGRRSAPPLPSPSRMPACTMRRSGATKSCAPWSPAPAMPSRPRPTRRC